MSDIESRGLLSIKGSNMKKLLRIIPLLALQAVTGCMIVEVPSEENDEYGYDDETYSINAYVNIPYQVRKLIYDAVYGYSMPPVSRYGTALYPATSYDPFNLPSYIKADFNVDGISDYAFMFSKVSWSYSDWYVKTKMLIVVSSYYGYEIASEVILGTITGPASMPVEEYWGIRLLEPGTHTVTTYQNGIKKEETIILYNDAIYLASVDPEERSIFYVTGNDTHEIRMDMGALAKRKAQSAEERANRIIQLGK